MPEAGPVRTVWIDNPPLNVITPALADAIADELRGLDETTRVVVLRGRGERAFSAGADLATLPEDGSPPGGLQPLAELVESTRVPVVAAIQGYCLGGGLELALACDLRLARRDAVFALPEVAHGLIPGGGGTQRAPRLLGPGRAAWLIFSGERLDAARAEAWGLVEFLVDDLEAGVEQVAGTIALRSPNAVAQAKQLLRETREQRSDIRELEVFAACVRSREGREGVAAFLEKREPRWQAD